MVGYDTRFCSDKTEATYSTVEKSVNLQIRFPQLSQENFEVKIFRIGTQFYLQIITKMMCAMLHRFKYHQNEWIPWAG
jgi:hypothetical protein